MKKNPNKKIMLIGGAAIAAGALVLLTSGSKKDKIGAENFTPVPSPSGPSPSVPSAPVVTLDGNKILKQGVTGQEVSKLQQLLGGLATDGIFGPLTEAALVKRKGVKQITLNQFASTADVNQNPAPVGAKLMALASGATLYEGIAKADGTYYAGDVEKTIANGQHVGTVKGYNATKTWYSVYYDSGFITGQRVGFVKANQVKPY